VILAVMRVDLPLSGLVSGMHIFGRIILSQARNRVVGLPRTRDSRVNCYGIYSRGIRYVTEVYRELARRRIVIGPLISTYGRNR